MVWVLESLPFDKGMGRLIVQTLTDRNSITAFVASEEGMPALDLELADFRVSASVPGADGSHLVIASVVRCALRGFYVLKLAPVQRVPSRKGLYVFDLIVERGPDRGQALSSVILT
jgi:hypothetical protein